MAMAQSDDARLEDFVEQLDLACAVLHDPRKGDRLKSIGLLLFRLDQYGRGLPMGERVAPAKPSAQVIRLQDRQRQILTEDRRRLRTIRNMHRSLGAPVSAAAD
jgi:hypothetical protein